MFILPVLTGYPRNGDLTVYVSTTSPDNHNVSAGQWGQDASKEIRSNICSQKRENFFCNFECKKFQKSTWKAMWTNAVIRFTTEWAR